MQAEGSRSPVALNSQEGSGNTWLRGLLEKATGICTGFYACDTEMRARAFLGEGIQSAHVLVVKTHVHIPKWKGEKSIPGLAYESFYGSGVFLIRNPARGVIAEWNRLVTLKQKEGKPESHTNVVFKEEFGECVSGFIVVHVIMLLSAELKMSNAFQKLLCIIIVQMSSIPYYNYDNSVTTKEICALLMTMHISQQQRNGSGFLRVIQNGGKSGL